MSSDVFETSADGRFRVRIVQDELAQAPDWDDPGPDEIAAYEAGDVFGIIVEEQVTWTTEQRTQLVITGNVGSLVTGPDTMQRWEDVDSCWGFYGGTADQLRYLHETARDMLTSAADVTK